MIGKVKQRHFGTYLSARQRKLHKDISEIVVSSRRPETFEFIGDFEEIITQQELNTYEEQNSTAEEVLSKDNKAIFEDHKHFSKEESPNLSQLFMGKDRLPMCILNALFCELLNILKRKDSSVDVIYGNDKRGRAIIVPQEKLSLLSWKWRRN